MKLNLECKNLVRVFNTHQNPAVDHVSFAIPEGSFFSILGPSGCGKSTLLRMIAGFEHPDAGDILIEGESILRVPPNKRPVNMVFQHLALFPMMTVAENIAYGLQRKKTDKSVIKKKVQEMLDKIDLPHIADRNINQLSGGQKQRVAIARSMVLEPKLILLDEPLGALDLKLREHMKVELKQLQNQFGTTFLYITHDQTEALMMSDQIAVMNSGRFEQIDSPQGIYYDPKTSFVAGFVGDNNRWEGVIHSVDGTEHVQVQTVGGLRFKGRCVTLPPDAGRSVNVFVRPEAISIVGQGMPQEANVLTCQVQTILFNAANSKAILKETTTGDQITIALPQTELGRQVREGDQIQITFSQQDCLCFGL